MDLKMSELLICSGIPCHNSHIRDKQLRLQMVYVNHIPPAGNGTREMHLTVRDCIWSQKCTPDLNVSCVRRILSIGWRHRSCIGTRRL
jgi:hypothetical protein